MIRLGLPREPRWLNLTAGARVRVRPLTTAIYEAARSSGQRKAVRVAVDQGLINAAGGAIVDLPDSSDKDGVAGLSQMFFVQGLAVHAIIEWEGIGDKDGNPAVVNEENIEELIRDHPGVADDFAVKYIAPLAEAISEGNGSGAVLNGSSEAAQNIVKPVEPTMIPVPEESQEETASHAQAR